MSGQLSLLSRPAWQPQLNGVWPSLLLLLGLLPGLRGSRSTGLAGGRSAGLAAVRQPAARRPGGGTACERETAGRAIRAPRGLGEAGLTSPGPGFDPCLLTPRRASSPLPGADPLVLGSLLAWGAWSGHVTLAKTSVPSFLSESLDGLGPQNERTCPEGGGGPMPALRV